MKTSRHGVRKQETRGKSLLADAAAMALLVLLAVAFYREIALTSKILPGVDAFTYFYPYRDHAAKAMCSGRVPLWNPYLFMGVPFLANAQTAVFYPLNAALCFLDGPQLVTWSIVLHVAMAAVFTYLFARRSLKLSVPPALLAASAFAFGGFLSGMVEHINQLNVLAWFPLLLLLWDLKNNAQTEIGRSPPSIPPASRGGGSLPCGTGEGWGGGHLRFEIAIGVVVALGLLAGHAQSTYICIAGLGVYALIPVLLPAQGQPGKAYFKVLGQTTLDLVLAVLLGALLAAIQLVPTLELSRLSIRGGGLSYREAIAFSLKPLPRLLRYTLLPPLGANLADQFGGDFFTEFVAYIGIVPIVLVIGWLGGAALSRSKGWLVRRRRPEPVEGSGGRSSISSIWSTLRRIAAQPAFRLLVLAGLGLFLALGGYNPLYYVLYKLAPGFGLFRVPARWLFLYAFGAATLAGVGLEKIANGKWQMAIPAASRLPPRVRGGLRGGVLIVALAELFWASQSLPLAHPTAPEAFSSLRTAPAHILAAQSQETMPGRFLSMSDILFDPGDQGEIAQMFAGQLDDKAIYDYVVSAKRKEILAPNLPLVWGVYAVDGYDGGVLPLQRYVDLQRLFLPADQVSPDGRLRENLKRIPPSRLLSLLGVRYVITDKVNDAWIDDVFYDLAFEAMLGNKSIPSISTTDLLDFEANALGIVAYVEGAAGESDTLYPNAQVVEIRLQTSDGEYILPLYRKQIGEGADTRRAARVQWPRAAEIDRIEIVAQPIDGTLHIQGVTLIDERDGSNVPVILSTDGRYRLVHSGDVKVYEVLDALPRAFVVHEAIAAADDEAALALLANPAFDLQKRVVLGGAVDGRLEPRPTGATNGGSKIRPTRYAPEKVELEVEMDVPGYLVLTDTYYPGWQATVDGQPAEILRANVNFRAVFLEPGTHTVELTYTPASYMIGLIVSLATVAMLFVVLIVAWIKNR